jgi:secreted PhoX family phosphatase
LYAADLTQGSWIELSVENVRNQLNRLTYQVPEALYKSREQLLEQFQSQSDVLAFASEAALIVGATPCDRPAELTIHPSNKAIFIACTRNDKRGNLHGHIHRLKEGSGSSFEFETFLAGGRQSGFSSPGSLAFDKNGNLWVGSDIPADKLNSGAWAEFKNNGMYLVHPSGEARRTKQYASAPAEAAIGGLAFSGNQDTVFMAVNHPGASGAGTGKPTSKWQRRQGEMQPRSAVVAITGTL